MELDVFNILFKASQPTTVNIKDNIRIVIREQSQATRTSKQATSPWFIFEVIAASLAHWRNRHNAVQCSVHTQKGFKLYKVPTFINFNDSQIWLLKWELTFISWRMTLVNVPVDTAGPGVRTAPGCSWRSWHRHPLRAWSQDVRRFSDWQPVTYK